MEFIEIIYQYLIRDIYLSWGRLINDLYFNSYLFLIIFILGYLVYLFFKIRRKSLTFKLFSLIISGIIIYFLLLIPFGKGRILNQYFSIGQEIVNSIEKYKDINNTYPENQQIIDLKNTGNIDFTNPDEGFHYTPHYLIYDNNNKFPEIRYINNYELNIKIPFLNSPKYFYSRRKHTFLSD